LGISHGTRPQRTTRRTSICADRYSIQAVSKRAGRKKDAAAGQPKAQFAKKAVFETTKKKEVGVSDLTLISKVSNEAINENLKKRFENGEIYVRRPAGASPAPTRYTEIEGESD
jgi:myosin heavy subunit